MIDVDDVTFMDAQKIKRKRVFEMLQRLVSVDRFAIDEFDVGRIVVCFEVDDVLKCDELVIAVRFDTDGRRRRKRTAFLKFK